MGKHDSVFDCRRARTRLILHPIWHDGVLGGFAMKSLAWFGAVFVGLLFTLVQPQAMAQLGPATYQCVETVIHNSQTVVVARITAIEGEREQLGQPTYKIRFEVEERIKGERDEQDYFYLFAKREQIEGWIKAEARLVLNSPRYTHINSESAGVVVDLTNRKQPMLSLGADGKLVELKKEEQLLKVLRKAAQRLPGVVQMRTFQMFAEPKLVKEANLKIQDGLPIVFVPIDRPLEVWAKRVIGGESELPIETGFRALSHFRTDENLDWAKRLYLRVNGERIRKGLRELLADWDPSFMPD